MADHKSTVGVAVLVVLLSATALGQTCSRYGGGSCCSDLTPVNRDLREDAFPNQPFYWKFVPDSDLARSIDNVCSTMFPLPDDPQTFLYYYSTVYCDGSYDITSYISSSPEPGVRRIGAALCSYSNTVFAELDHTNVDPACDLSLMYRCSLRGDCPSDVPGEGVAPVYGFSNIRRPISRSCLNSVKSTIRNNGLPDQDYYILPMRLPTRCVFNQVCTIQSVLQRFRQAVGVAFPTLRYH